MNRQQILEAIAQAEYVAFWAMDPPNLAVVLPLGDSQVEVTHAHAAVLELSGDLEACPIDAPDGKRLGVMFIPATRTEP